MKDHLLFRNQRKVKRKTEQHQIEALYEDAPTHKGLLLKIKGSKKQPMMIEEPEDEDDRKISSTQMHRRRRDEE